MKTIEGNLSGRGKKFAIIQSRFNHFITDRLVEGSIDALLRHEVEEEGIVIYKVPGSFELPVTAKLIAQKKKFDAIIALACIIQGATPHFEYIASEVAKGLAQVALETGTPVIFGVLTTDSIEQAIERAGVKEGNKGWQSALSAIEMANLFVSLKNGGS